MPGRDQGPIRESEARVGDARVALEMPPIRERAASFAPPPRRHRERSAVRRFVHRFGWRAYALPVLVIVTVVALIPMSKPHSNVAADPGRPAPAAPPVATGSTSIKADHPGAGAQTTAIDGAALPAGEPYSQRGSGTYRVLPGTTAPVGRGQTYRYSIEVENGIGGVDLAAFTHLVDATLADARSWAGHGDDRLQRVDSGPVDFHLSLVTPMTVREVCGYDIPVETSCYTPASDTSPVNRVLLNLARWVRGDAAYLGDIEAYRVYMVNHEVGHALGHQHAHSCLAGGLAPIMMQQTIGLRSAKTGQMCQANPWPYPPGVAGTPGHEEPDTPQNSEFVLNGD